MEALKTKLESMGWTVEKAIFTNDFVITKTIEPIGNLIMCMEIPATGSTFIYYDLTSQKIQYLLHEIEFEHILGVLTKFEFEQ